MFFLLIHLIPASIIGILVLLEGTIKPKRKRKVNVVTYQSIRAMYGDEQVIYTFRVVNGQRQGMAQMSFVRQ